MPFLNVSGVLSHSKKALKLAKRLEIPWLSNTDSENLQWCAVKQQENLMDDVLKDLPAVLGLTNGDPQLSDPELRDILAKQLDLLTVATSAHAQITKSITPDRFFNEQNKFDKVKQLLTLNRNMRIYNIRLRDLLGSTTANDQASQQIQNTVNGNQQILELARLHIYNPSDAFDLQSDDDRESMELDRIIGLYARNSIEFRTAAEQLHAEPGISWFIRSVLEILAAAGSPSPLSVPARLALLRVAAIQLTTLRQQNPPDTCPDWWNGPLDYWIKNAAAVIQKNPAGAIGNPIQIS
jgi:hypothetical protein